MLSGLPRVEEIGRAPVACLVFYEPLILLHSSLTTRVFLYACQRLVFQKDEIERLRARKIAKSSVETRRAEPRFWERQQQGLFLLEGQAIDCMTSVQTSPIDSQSGTSPRSTVLAGSDHMTTAVASMNATSMASGLATGDRKVASPKETTTEVTQSEKSAPTTPTDEKGDDLKDRATPDQKDEKDPQPHDQTASPSHPGASSAGYNIGYQPSPTISNPGLTYDTAIGSFIQQQPGGAFAAPHNSPFGHAGATTPLSPPRSNTNMVAVPPASPLFPRVNSGGLEGAPPQSPSLPYMSPNALGSAAMGYPPTYASTVRINSQASLSSDGEGGWDRYVDACLYCRRYQNRAILAWTSISCEAFMRTEYRMLLKRLHLIVARVIFVLLQQS